MKLELILVSNFVSNTLSRNILLGPDASEKQKLSNLSDNACDVI